MGVPAAAAGFGTGFRLGLDGARQRRLEEQEIARQRQRQDVADRQAAERQSLSMESGRLSLESARRAVEREPQELARRHEAEDVELEGSRLGLDSARRAAEREPEDYRLKHETDTLALSNMRNSTKRSDLAYEQSVAELRRRGQQEGMDVLVHSLQAGVDPQLAMQRYNELGQDKIRGLEYDRGTGRLRVDAGEGRGFDGTLEQLRAVFGIETKNEPVKLGENDRLVQRDGDGSYNTLVDAAPGSGYADFLVPLARKLAAGGRLTPGEQQAADLLQHTNQLDRVLNSTFGGGGSTGFDAPGGADSVLQEARDAIAQGADPEAVSRRLRDLGVDASALDAGAGPGAAREVGARAERPALVEKPDWAQAEVPQAILGDAQIERGFEYDVRINGREATIRLGDDGKVYEVGRAGAEPPSPPATRAADASGVVEPGNIDVSNRAAVKDPGTGEPATVRTIGIEEDGLEVVIPTVVGGRVVSDDEAIKHYRETGEHFGKFKDRAAADAFAEQLHEREKARISTKVSGVIDRSGGQPTAGLSLENMRRSRAHQKADPVGAMLADARRRPTPFVY